MKTKKEIKPNYAPVYAAALYPDLAQLFIENGYALAVHGSLARDFDLIAVPWVVDVSKPEDVVAQVVKRFAVKQIDEPEVRNGRIIYTLSIGFGSCFIDLSFV